MPLQRPASIARLVSRCALAAAAVLALAACDDGTAPSDPEDTLADSADLTLDTSAPADVADLEDTTRPETREPDTAEDLAVDTSPDTEPDQAEDTDVVVNFGRTLADYRRCTIDNDCPVGLGLCLKEVPLNRPDATGADRVQLSALFPELGSNQGICTRACTTSDTECQGLSVNGTTPDAAPHVCQLIYVGTPPYPQPAPDFPFAAQLDPSALAQGSAFGAICRPPFQLHAEVDDGLCTACIVGTNNCSGIATCWNALGDRPATAGEAGFCLAPCGEDQACPLGFECLEKSASDATPLGEFCWPIEDTCTSCRDHDRDQRGDGRCGPAAAPITPHDCDDKDPDAWYDPTDPTHPFPTFCGVQDLNCNGLSDDSEQIGTVEFGGWHCTSCSDACSGTVPNAQRSCNTGTCRALCDDPTTHADCDGDLENGCETVVTDPSVLYYPDDDGDGRGDPSRAFFACTPGEVPAGYVQDASDCNDASPVVYGAGAAGGAALELCDGLDNDCDGHVDNGVPQVSQPCTTGLPGVCSNGTYSCQGVLGLRCDGFVLPGSQPEVCDGLLDEDCDGAVDEDGANGSVWFFRDVDGDGYGNPLSARQACVHPTGYVINSDDCDDSRAAVNPGVAELCSTAWDDNCDGTINEPTASDAPTWYRDGDGDGYPRQDDTRVQCTAPANYIAARGDGKWDCDDQAATVNPGAPERCSTPTDDNCDGHINDSSAIDTTRFYFDGDGDAYGTPNSFLDRCEQPLNYVANNGDCDDNVSTINPMATEVCDGINNDCDAMKDEGCPASFRWSGITQLAWLGASSGHSLATDDCPAGKILMGLAINSVDQVGACNTNGGVYGLQTICRSISFSTDTAALPYLYNVTSSDSQWGPTRGTWSAELGALGSCNHMRSWQTLGCNNGSNNEFLTGLRMWTGQRLDRVQGLCKHVDINTNLLPATPSLGTEASTSVLLPEHYTGGDEYVRRCASGSVAVGVATRVGSDGLLKGVALRCAPLQLNTH